MTIAPSHARTRRRTPPLWTAVMLMSLAVPVTAATHFEGESLTDPGGASPATISDSDATGGRAAQVPPSLSTPGGVSAGLYAITARVKGTARARIVVDGNRVGEI